MNNYRYIVFVKNTWVKRVLSNADYASHLYDYLEDARKFMDSQTRHTLLFEFVDERNV